MLPWLIAHLKKFRILAVLLTASLLLTGCVDYDVGINYYSQTGGEIVQHVRLGDQLTSFSGNVAQEWLKSLEERSRKLGGRSQRLSSQELTLTIPFNNGKDLEKKFNQFFHPVEPRKVASEGEETSGVALPNLQSNLIVKENNLLLVQRNRLVFDLDLTDLSLLSSDGNVLINPGSLLSVQFQLNTPWGARSPVTTHSPQTEQNGRQLVWTLNTGEKTHLEATFWVPSPLGLGTAGIGLLVASGSLLKAFLQREA